MMIMIIVEIIMIRLTNWFQKVETICRWAARNLSTSRSWLWSVLSIKSSSSSSSLSSPSLSLPSSLPIPVFPCIDRQRSRQCWIGTLSSHACALSTSDQTYGNHNDDHDNHNDDHDDHDNRYTVKCRTNSVANRNCLMVWCGAYPLEELLSEPDIRKMRMID